MGGAARGALWDMESRRGQRRALWETQTARGTPGNGVSAPPALPSVWLLLTARLEGGAAPGPILQLGKPRPGRAALGPRPFRPTQPRPQRSPRPPAHGGPCSHRPTASRGSRGLPAPAAPSGPLPPEAPPPARPPIGRRRPVRPALGRELIGRARQPSVFESAAGGRTLGLCVSRSGCSVRRPAE